MPETQERGWTLTRDQHTVAVAMHEALCGSWDAAGYQVKVSFVKAAEAALAVLAEDGWDLFAYPDGGWAANTEGRPE